MGRGRPLRDLIIEEVLDFYFTMQLNETCIQLFMRRRAARTLRLYITFKVSARCLNSLLGSYRLDIYDQVKTSCSNVAIVSRRPALSKCQDKSTKFNQYPLSLLDKQ